MPGRGSPGSGSSTNGTGPSPTRFLSRAVAITTASGSAPVDRDRQPVRVEQLGDLVAERSVARQAQRGEQPEPDRLAVAVASHTRSTVSIAWPTV